MFVSSPEGWSRFNVGKSPRNRSQCAALNLTRREQTRNWWHTPSLHNSWHAQLFILTEALPIIINIRDLQASTHFQETERLYQAIASLNHCSVNVLIADDCNLENNPSHLGVWVMVRRLLPEVEGGCQLTRRRHSGSFEQRKTAAIELTLQVP